MIRLERHAHGLASALFCLHGMVTPAASVALMPEDSSTFAVRSIKFSALLELQPFTLRVGIAHE